MPRRLPAPQAGSPGYPALSVQHEVFYRIDVESARAGPPDCGNNRTVQAQVTVPGRERHPACVAWAPRPDGSPPAPPACPPAPTLSGLSAAEVGSRFLNASGDLLDPTSPHVPRELRLKLRVNNTSPGPVPLAGVTLTVPFSRMVYIPGLQWVAAEPDEWQTDCFWWQMKTAAGTSVSGLPNACSYVALNVTQKGLEITFLGGTLCGGCSIAGAPGPADAVAVVKHASYLQMDDGADPAAAAAAAAAASGAAGDQGPLEALLRPPASGAPPVVAVSCHQLSGPPSICTTKVGTTAGAVSL